MNIIFINITIMIVMITGASEGGQNGQDYGHPGLPNSMHAEQSNHPLS